MSWRPWLHRKSKNVREEGTDVTQVRNGCRVPVYSVREELGTGENAKTTDYKL